MESEVEEQQILHQCDYNCGSMNKMTSKQYLIDITLISLNVNHQAKSASKVLCEIHYGAGDSYLRIKLQPLIKNGLASFYEERIRFPYSADVALVFKILRGKKEIFLGHHSIQVDKFLEEKVYSGKFKEKLEECDSWVEFEIKIIDKQLFCDDESDDLQDEIMFPTSRSNYSEQQKSKAKYSDYKPKSDYHSPFVIIKRQEMRVPILAEQFDKLLLGVEDIVKKHRIIEKLRSEKQKQDSIQGIINKNQKQSSVRVQLQAQISAAKSNQEMNNYILWLCVALLGFFIGVSLKN